MDLRAGSSRSPGQQVFAVLVLALAQRHARQAMTGANVNGRRKAVLLLPNGERYERSRQLDFTEAGIDPATAGTSPVWDSSVTGHNNSLLAACLSGNQ